jgi:hypothetical protein
LYSHSKYSTMKMLFINYAFWLFGLWGCENKTTAAISQVKKETMNQGKQIEVNGMTVEWQHRNGAVIFTISAPTQGWVTLGFNDKDDIVHTNLILC